MENYLLSFEQTDDYELIIHGDEEGLKALCNILNNLIKNTREGCFNHNHLMTPDWGGNELSTKSMGGKVINQVKVYCWKGKEFQK